MYKLIAAFILSLFLISFCIVEAFGAEIDLGATEHSGSIESQVYHAGANASSEEFSVNAQWNYGKVTNIVTTDNGNLRFGYDPKLSKHWGLWFFNQTGYNNIRGIVIENLLGVGPKYTFIKNDTVSASLSAGIIYHYENGAYGKRNLARLSIRPKAKISDGSTTISFVAFYQPDIEDFKDYIIDARLVSEQKVTETLSLKLVLTDEYRSITEGSKNEFTRMLIMGIKL